MRKNWPKCADYILYYQPNIPIALIEAKDNNHSVGDGIQQGLEYAATLDIPFVFSSIGANLVFFEKERRPRRQQHNAPQSDFWIFGLSYSMLFNVLKKMKAARELFETHECGILEIIRAADIYALHLMSKFRDGPPPQSETIANIMDGAVSIMNFTAFTFTGPGIYKDEFCLHNPLPPAIMNYTVACSSIVHPK